MAYELPQFNLFNSVYSIVGGDLQSVMQVVFGLIAFFFVIYSAILVYHWLKYGLERRIIKRALSSYFLVSLFLLLMLAYATWNITR